MAKFNEQLNQAVAKSPFGKANRKKIVAKAVDEIKKQCLSTAKLGFTHLSLKTEDARELLAKALGTDTQTVEKWEIANHYKLAKKIQAALTDEGLKVSQHHDSIEISWKK